MKYKVKRFRRDKELGKKEAELAAVKHQLAEVQRRAATQEVAQRQHELEAQARSSQGSSSAVDSFGTHALDVGGTRAACSAGSELLLRSVAEQAARKRMRPIDTVRMRQQQRSVQELSTLKERLEEDAMRTAQMLEQQNEKHGEARAQERDKASQMRADVSRHQRDAKVCFLVNELPSLAHLPNGHFFVTATVCL